MKRFGVSTHLYHDERLQKAHLLEIAANGFDAVELFATRSHFDYHDRVAILEMKEWLAESGLTLHSVHAPITDAFLKGRVQRNFSTAFRDSEARRATMREMELALDIVTELPFSFFVVHLGVPDEQRSGSDDNHRDAAIRSIEDIHAMAERAGVRVALEIMGNRLSTAADLVELLDRTFEGANLGICMDVGHAHILGDAADAIETTSEYLVTTHIHDNRGHSDDHLVPFQGSIDWAATIMAFEKIGYDGVLMYEVKAAQGTRPVLERAVAARRRLEALMMDSLVDDLAVGTATDTGMIAYIDHIAQSEGKSVTIRGWLHNRRSSGKIHFLSVRDGSGFIQAIVSKAAVGDEKFKQADHLSQETAIIVHGMVRADSRAPGGYELDVSDFEVVSPSVDYPITPKEHGIDYLLDRRHLWIRSEKQAAILRVRHEVVSAVRDFFNDQGFILADTPIFTPAACEGTTTLFPVDYFEDQKVFLTQSGQLYAEANAMALGRVYNFGPVFRAEKSKTRRHLTEFWMVEPEMAYATLDDVIDLAEGLVVTVVSRVLEKRQRELKVLERDISKLELVTAPFPRISYDDAVKILHDKGQPFEWGGDLGGTDETVLSQHFDRPVAIHRYPASVKPFYMESDPARPELALCVDMLAPEGIGEIIGGSQRLASYDVLLQRIKDHHLPQEAFEWYLDLRRFGSVPHGGFGMGIERVVGWICGLEHVREATPFPRMMYRVTP